MIDDFEYYRNKLKKPDRYHPQLLNYIVYKDGMFTSFPSKAELLNTRQTFAAVTVIKDGVLTVEWKVEEWKE